MVMSPAFDYESLERDAWCGVYRQAESDRRGEALLGGSGMVGMGRKADWRLSVKSLGIADSLDQC